MDGEKQTKKTRSVISLDADDSVSVSGGGFRDHIIQQCLDIIKQDNVKNNIKQAFKPLIDEIIDAFSPHVIFIYTLFILIFITSIANLLITLYTNTNVGTILWRKKNLGNPNGINI